MVALANVARFLPEMARRHPRLVAMRSPVGRPGHDGFLEYRTLDFTRLAGDTAAAAYVLARRGLRRGDRVLMAVPPGTNLLQVAFALLHLGAVPVLIDPGMGLKQVLQAVTRTQPVALIGIPRAILLSYLFRRAFASVRQRVVVNDDWQREVHIAAHQGEHALLAPTTADELAAILFTSGSTGPAKGVHYTHGIFEAQVELVRQTYGIAPGEVDLPMLPIFALFNPALGMSTVVPAINPSRPASFLPAVVVRQILQHGVTNSFGSPTLWRKVADWCLARRLQLPSLRRILLAGAPVPPRLLADLRQVAPQAALHTPYGATEVLPVASIEATLVLGETAARTARGLGTCVGRPLSANRVAILPTTADVVERFDERQGCPPGVIGEIVVRGPTVTPGYDGLPEATAKAKMRDATDGARWHRMGDHGYLDETGQLWFCGRVAERVDTAAGPLYTELVEGVYRQHPAIARCALIGIGVPGEATPALVIELKRPAPPISPAALVTELVAVAQGISVAARVRHFFLHRGSLPVDVRHNAKIHRLELAKLYAQKLGQALTAPGTSA